MKLLYRYYDPWIEPWDKLELAIYKIVKTTPCGYWLTQVGSDGKLWSDFSKHEQTWRRKDGHFAFENKKDALVSYLRRKKSHIGSLKYRLRKATAGQMIGYHMMSGKHPLPILGE